MPSCSGNLLNFRSMTVVKLTSSPLKQQPKTVGMNLEQVSVMLTVSSTQLTLAQQFHAWQMFMSFGKIVVTIMNLGT